MNHPGKEFPFFIRLFFIHSIPQLNSDHLYIGQNSRSSENEKVLREEVEIPSSTSIEVRQHEMECEMLWSLFTFSLNWMTR